MEKTKLTPQEVADYMRLSKDYIYQLCRTGELPCVKIGRRYVIDRDSLERWFSDKEKTHSGQECE